MVNTARSVCLGLAAGNDNNCLSPVTFTNGFLDDVRIYNRALSATEISQLYKLGQDKIATTPIDKLNGLVGHWTFDGPDLLQNVRDRSSQGKKGLLITV